MNETARCYNCQNVNAVKVSSGHNKPENKGRKYFTCAGCNQFQWVENGLGVSPSGLKVDYTKTPERSVPQGTVTLDGESPADLIRESTEEQGPDWDEIRRKEYRFRGAMELVKNHGLVDLTEKQKAGIKKLVEFAMTGE